MASPMAKSTVNRDGELWQAVLNRDASRDGSFVYAVETTGVFCRPTCPSRRPLRKNVAFYRTPQDALRAGFRPCRRCCPEGPAAPDAAKHKVLEACRYLEAVQDRIPTLDELGKHVGLSPAHLQRVFRKVVGLSPRKYADALRVARLKEELRGGESIAGAMYGTGYGSSSRLYESARAALGMTPKEYREKADGERIQYVTVKSPLGGSLLVAATERGVCAVRLGESAKDLVAELEIEFAGASIERRSDPSLRESLDALLQYLAGDHRLPDLPYDVEATAFQRQVWDAIRSIPSGATATYGELAQQLGKPKAVRAVASACASNPVALVIPCHRVVPKQGGTGGYRWGTDRKQKLLELEKRRDRE